MRTFPSVNVDEAFHPLSHHGEDPDKHEKLVRVQAYETERFARFIKRLQGMKEGNSSILDNSIILFGSNMANSDLHNNNPLPQLIAGQGRRHQGRPAPGHAAGHAAREHPADDGAARRRQHRQVRRFDRLLQRSLTMKRGVKRTVAATVAAILLASTTIAAPKADVDARRPDGSTPLLWAAFDGDVAEAARLLKAGADVKATNNYGINAMLLGGRHLQH